MSAPAPNHKRTGGTDASAPKRQKLKQHQFSTSEEESSSSSSDEEEKPKPTAAQRNALIKQLHPTCIFFKSNKAVEGQAYLSNFWPDVPANVFQSVRVRVPSAHILDFQRGFWLGGVLYRTVEHYYQSAKFANKEDVDAILATPTAMDAKKLNTQFKNQKRPVKPGFFALENQRKVMEEAVFAKFDQNEILRNLLLQTGDAPLHESSGRGGGMWAHEATKAHGQCADELGKILVKVRTRLREGVHPASREPLIPSDMFRELVADLPEPVRLDRARITAPRGSEEYLNQLEQVFRTHKQLLTSPSYRDVNLLEFHVLQRVL